MPQFNYDFQLRIFQSIACFLGEYGMGKVCLALVLGACCIGLGFAYPQGGKGEDKATVSDIMKEGMKGLNRKVISGEATPEEKIQFLNLMIDLVENDPPQGDPAEWKSMAGVAMINTAKVVVGREGAGEALKDALNCKA
jgi:hypothetical protein